jgi:hypothetical protein
MMFRMYIRTTMVIAFPFLCAWEAVRELKDAAHSIWLRWCSEAADFRRYWNMEPDEIREEFRKMKEDAGS